MQLREFSKKFKSFSIKTCRKVQVFTGRAQKRLGGDSCLEPLSLSVQTECPRCWTRTLGGGSFCLGCSGRLGQVAVGLTAALPPSLRSPAARPTLQASPPRHELCPFSAGFYRCQGLSLRDCCPLLQPFSSGRTLPTSSQHHTP